MLIIFQFSFTDCRRFITEESGRLNKPTWPLPQFKHFLRFGGAVKKRLKGGVEEIGEGTVCQIDNAFSFAKNPSFEVNIPVEKRTQRVVCHRLFSRFYFDGLCTAKYEIGLKPDIPKNHNLKEVDLVSGIIELLDAVCFVKNSNGAKVQCKLSEFDQALAEHYKIASTSNQWMKEHLSQKWWVVPSTPLIYVETEKRDAINIKTNSIYKVLETGKLSFWQTWINCKNQPPIRLWHRHADSITTNEEQQLARKLRIILMRFHADQEAICILLGHIAEQNLHPEKNTAETNNLQLFLVRAISRIKKDERRVGEVSANLFDSVRDTYASMSEGEMDSILQKLEVELNIRPKALRNLAELIKTKHLKNKGHNVTNIIIGDNNKGIINIQGKIENAKNSVNELKEDDIESTEIKTLLTKLTERISEVAEKQNNIALVENLNRVISEVNQQKPHKMILGVSLEGIKEAAQTLGDIGKPIIELVSKLVPLLAI